MLLCGGDDNVVGDYNMVMVVLMSTVAVVVAILMTIVVLVRWGIKYLIGNPWWGYVQIQAMV